MHKKGKTSKEHWEIRYSSCQEKNTPKEVGAEFNPQKSNKRKTSYNPVNKEDH